MKWIKISELGLPKHKGQYNAKDANGKPGILIMKKQGDQLYRAASYFTPDVWLDESTPPLPNIVEEEWISVEEDMPGYMETVLIVVKDLGFVVMAQYTGEKPLFDCGYTYKATHWRPLPKPPAHDIKK